MRVRLVVPPEVDQPTGGNVYDLALAAGLRRLGEDVELVECSAADLPGLVSRAWPGPTLVDGLLACMQPTPVASDRLAVLVHLPVALGGGLGPDAAARLAGAEGAALRAAHTVVVTSRWTADYLAEHYSLAAVTVATPGVDPAPVMTGSDPPLLVQVAAVLPHKDQLSVVRALAGIRDLSWQARLVGDVERDPSYVAEVRRAVAAAGLADRVELPGVLPRDQAWAGADLALLPSRVETYGMVVTEALARGIPAVVSEGGPRAALGRLPTGELPGVVVTPGDSDELGGVLRHWLEDPAYRDELRRRALARRETLDGWEVTAQRVREALRSLASGS